MEALREVGRGHQWEAWNWSCDLRANERPKKTAFDGANRQTNRRILRLYDWIKTVGTGYPPLFLKQCGMENSGPRLLYINNQNTFVFTLQKLNCLWPELFRPSRVILKGEDSMSVTHGRKNGEGQIDLCTIFIIYKFHNLSIWVLSQLEFEFGHN